MIYLDYNATTPLSPVALEAMLPYLREHFGNPSSIHAAGRETRAALDLARDRMAALLGTKSHEIIFTGGGTEADNLGIIGLARSRAAQGRHLITSAVEHHAVLHACEYLAKYEGFRVTYLPVNARGVVDLQQLVDAFTPETTLVSLMSANNETGAVQPVQEAARLCRERGILFHTDAIQSFGKAPLRAGDFDALSLAAHKFYGPKGAGLLYLRAGNALQALQLGGSHEGQRRAGTEDVAAITGMVSAAEWVVREMAAEQARQGELRDALWRAIEQTVPGVLLNSDLDHGLRNTLNVCFPGTDGESLLMNLDLAGICASSGSACMVGSIMPSHVLLAMGRSEAEARAAVRFSLGRSTTAEDVATTARVVSEMVPRLLAA